MRALAYAERIVKLAARDIAGRYPLAVGKDVAKPPVWD
jgi:hypothetical protein